MMHLFEFILGLLAKVLTGELVAWSPKLADKLIYYSAMKVPDELKERLTEEWRAHLADIPGDLSKLLVALSVLYGCARIRHEYHYPEIPYRPYSMMALGVCDRVLAAILLIVLLPLTILIVLIIRITSRGPVFTADVLANARGESAHCICFRTVFVRENRMVEVTWFGRWLRQVGLDILPYLFNVLTGEMSIIGWRATRIFSAKSARRIVQDQALPPSIVKAGIVPLGPDELLVSFKLHSQTTQEFWGARCLLCSQGKGNPSLIERCPIFDCLQSISSLTLQPLETVLCRPPG